MARTRPKTFKATGAFSVASTRYQPGDEVAGPDLRQVLAVRPDLVTDEAPTKTKEED